ncbi:MAG: MBL fold metallo-hydrolase [Planctomycetota bacterium]|nr:MAG: MBL fold metallo-hydrolase [Planctomycetota bacterium]
MYLRTYEHEGRTGYLFGPEGFSGPLAVVDPVGSIEPILAERRERPIERIVLTSGHFDAEAVRALQRHTDARLGAHRLLGPRLEKAGIAVADRLSGGDRFEVGGIEVRVLATPGIDRGSIVLLAGGAWLFTGLTLPTGPRRPAGIVASDPVAHYVSLRMLSQLPPGTIVLPGARTAAERRSTLGRELERNPLLTAADLAAFRAAATGSEPPPEPAR